MCAPTLLRTFIILVYAVTTSAFKDEKITIPDAGRRMQLGGFYDARTDTVVPGHLWDMSADVINHYKYETPASSSTMTFTTDDTFESRSKLLDIGITIGFMYSKGPLSLDIEGSFKYLKSSRSSSRSIVYSAGYRMRSKRETLDVLNDEMFGNVDDRIFGGKNNDCEKCKIATHFVSSITWGANVFASFESYYSDAASKFKMKIGLEATLSVCGYKGIEAGGNIELGKARRDIRESTKVIIYGDIDMANTKIPADPIDAAEFMRDLPLRANTIVEGQGIGVPMEIELTPLTWIDPSAAQLKNKFEEETILRLLKIYDSLEDSASYIEDLRLLPYGGFIAWKVSMDAFRRDVNEYNARLVVGLDKLTKEYIAGTKSMQDLIEFELSYWEETNPFNSYAVINECKKIQNDITNLMALSSQFNDAGITFADHLSDFYAPTYDGRFDRVYALVLVGTNPSNDRNAINRVRDFVDLANSHKWEGRPKGINHCRQKEIVGSSGGSVCIETEAFVAIHFDSFCADICNSEFCAPPGEDLMPTSSRVSCGSNSTIYEMGNNRLYSNTYTGDCYIDDAGKNVTWDDVNGSINPKHNISDNNLPFSDCWCSCPQTQMMEFVHNSSPKRLIKDIPRIPSKPYIKSISGHTKNEMEPFGNNQKIQLNLRTNLEFNAAQSWRVSLNYLEYVKSTEYEEAIFEVNEEVIYTRTSNVRVVLRNLDAGRHYDIAVAGVNSVGVGLPSEKISVQIGHRLADMHVSMSYVNATDPSNPIDFQQFDVPSWRIAHLNLRLSTPSSDKIFKITVHEDNIDPDCVDSYKKECYDMAELVTECVELKDASESGTSCVLPKLEKVLTEDTLMELRVWDNTNFLIATNKINFLIASPENCKKYGDTC